MIIRILVCAFSLVLGQSAFSQEPAAGADAAFAFIDSAFKTPAVAFEINELLAPDSIAAILIKFNNAMAENKEWAAAYMNKYYKPGEGMPYNEKFGITKEEYNKIKNADKSPFQLHKVKTEKLQVINDDQAITFKTTDSFRILSYLEFRKASRIVTFGRDTVLFLGALNTPAESPLGISHGYRWHYEKSNQREDADINIHELSSKIIEIGLGRTIPANRTFLRIKYQQIEKGEKKAYMELIGFID